MISTSILNTYLSNPDGKKFDKALVLSLYRLCITNHTVPKQHISTHHNLYIYHNDTEFCVTDLGDIIEFAAEYMDRFEWFIRVPYCKVTIDNLEQRFPDIGLSTLECSVIC